MSMPHCATQSTSVREPPATSCGAPISVPSTDTFRHAFQRLHQSGLNGLPVTDADRRVVAYLDQLELLMAWVDATGRELLLKPTPDEPA